MASKLALFYKTLGQTLGGGLPLAKALDLSTAPHDVRHHLASRLLAGATWEEALAGAPPWIPHHHRAVLAAAASAGRLPETLALLSADAERLHDARRQALGAALYPVGLVHFAALVLPAAELILGTTAGYLRAVATLLVPIWAAIFVLTLWIRSRPEDAFAAGLWVPGLGSWLRQSQIARLAALLEAQLAAGVPISTAWERAAEALRWRRLRAAATAAAAHARAGQSPSETFAAAGVFPQTFIQLYATGEASGSLDDALRTLAKMHGESATRSLAAAAFWYPQILYGVVALWIAFRVITFYAGYLGRYDQYLE